MRKAVAAMGASLVAFLLLLSPLHAAEKSTGFANNKVVLQISDGSPEKQQLVLNVANNIISHYGQDNVKVEIVAFGPGLRLLFADNANKDRVQSLDATGVRFSACENTITNMAKLLGHQPKLGKEAVKVSAGVVRIMDLQREGYTLVRP